MVAGILWCTRFFDIESDEAEVVAREVQKHTALEALNPAARALGAVLRHLGRARTNRPVDYAMATTRTCLEVKMH